MSPVRVFAVLLTLCFAAPVIAAGKPIKNKTKHVEVANLNILHGFACDPLSPDDGDQCRVVERMDRLIEEIAAAGSRTSSRSRRTLPTRSCCEPSESRWGRWKTPRR
jgi:hypothetical protein